MNESSGERPEPLERWHVPKTLKSHPDERCDTWPFSFRHFSRYGKSRRLISRYPYASLSYGKSERDLDLPEAAGRRAEGRVRGMRRRRSLNDWRGGGGGRDHAGQGAAK